MPAQTLSSAVPVSNQTASSAAVVAGKRSARMKIMCLALLFVFAAVLMLINLPLNPHPWHDEGAALLVSKTLAQEGIYAAIHFNK